MNYIRETPIGPGILAAVLVVLMLGWAPPVRADIIIDFENEPALPAQPDNFAAAGAMQTYMKPGVYTISGGVALGNPSFLAAFAGNGGSFGSAPNLYGTTDTADPSLQDTIKLVLPAAENVTQVAATLFNGQNFQEDYTITTTIGGVSFPTPVTLGPNTDANGSATNFSVTSFAGAITEVDFATPNAGTNGWDFFVDDLRIHPTPTTVVPEPGSLTLLGLGLLGLLGYGWRARKRVA